MNIDHIDHEQLITEICNLMLIRVKSAHQNVRVINFNGVLSLAISNGYDEKHVTLGIDRSLSASATTTVFGGSSKDQRDHKTHDDQKSPNHKQPSTEHQGLYDSTRCRNSLKDRVVLTPPELVTPEYPNSNTRDDVSMEGKPASREQPLNEANSQEFALLKKIKSEPPDTPIEDFGKPVQDADGAPLVTSRSFVESKSDRPIFWCDPCNIGFYSKIGLIAHNSYRHDKSQMHLLNMPKDPSEEKQQTKPIFVKYCPTCGRRFYDKHSLARHITFHSTERRFKCDVCQVGFVRKDGLSRHMMRVHLNPSMLSCQFCGRRFRYDSSLANHESKCPFNPDNHAVAKWIAKPRYGKLYHTTLPQS